MRTSKQLALSNNVPLCAEASFCLWMCPLPVSSLVLKLMFRPRWEGQPCKGQLTANGHSLTSTSHHWWRLQKAWERQECVLDAKKKSVMAIMPPVCHWVTWLGYSGEIYAFGFWVALGFRFRENCLDMITHQTGTVVFWVKAMRDRRLGPRPGTFLCLFVLFKLLLKILPLAFAKGICALLQNYVHCSMKTK